ncbi:hypothetical protein HDU96_010896, partial [Phlyctochytrium bullatum]
MDDDGDGISVEQQHQPHPFTATSCSSFFVNNHHMDTEDEGECNTLGSDDDPDSHLVDDDSDDASLDPSDSDHDDFSDDVANKHVSFATPQPPPPTIPESLPADAIPPPAEFRRNRSFKATNILALLSTATTSNDWDPRVSRTEHKHPEPHCVQQFPHAAGQAGLPKDEGMVTGARTGAAVDPYAPVAVTRTTSPVMAPIQSVARVASSTQLAPAPNPYAPIAVTSPVVPQKQSVTRVASTTRLAPSADPYAPVPVTKNTSPVMPQKQTVARVASATQLAPAADPYAPVPVMKNTSPVMPAKQSVARVASATRIAHDPYAPVAVTTSVSTVTRVASTTRLAPAADPYAPIAVTSPAVPPTQTVTRVASTARLAPAADPYAPIAVTKPTPVAPPNQPILPTTNAFAPVAVFPTSRQSVLPVDGHAPPPKTTSPTVPAKQTLDHAQHRQAVIPLDAVAGNRFAPVAVTRPVGPTTKPGPPTNNPFAPVAVAPLPPQQPSANPFAPVAVMRVPSTTDTTVRVVVPDPRSRSPQAPATPIPAPHRKLSSPPQRPVAAATPVPVPRPAVIDLSLDQPMPLPSVPSRVSLHELAWTKESDSEDEAEGKTTRRTWECEGTGRLLRTQSGIVGATSAVDAWGLGARYHHAPPPPPAASSAAAALRRPRSVVSLNELLAQPAPLIRAGGAAATATATAGHWVDWEAQRRRAVEVLTQNGVGVVPVVGGGGDREARSVGGMSAGSGGVLVVSESLGRWSAGVGGTSPGRERTRRVVSAAALRGGGMMGVPLPPPVPLPAKPASSTSSADTSSGSSSSGGGGMLMMVAKPLRRGLETVEPPPPPPPSAMSAGMVGREDASPKLRRPSSQLGRALSGLALAERAGVVEGSGTRAGKDDDDEEESDDDDEGVLMRVRATVGTSGSRHVGPGGMSPRRAPVTRPPLATVPEPPAQRHLRKSRSALAISPRPFWSATGMAERKGLAVAREEEDEAVGLAMLAWEGAGGGAGSRSAVGIAELRGIGLVSPGSSGSSGSGSAASSSLATHAPRTAQLPFRAFPSAPFLPAFAKDPASGSLRRCGSVLMGAGGSGVSTAGNRDAEVSETIGGGVAEAEAVAAAAMGAIPIQNAREGPHVSGAAAKLPPAVAAIEEEADKIAAANAARARALGVPHRPEELERRLKEMRGHHERQVEALREQHRILRAVAAGGDDAKANTTTTTTTTAARVGKMPSGEMQAAQLRGLEEAQAREERALVDAAARVLGAVAYRVAGYVVPAPAREADVAPVPVSVSRVGGIAMVRGDESAPAAEPPSPGVAATLKPFAAVLEPAAAAVAAAPAAVAPAFERRDKAYLWKQYEHQLALLAESQRPEASFGFHGVRPFVAEIPMQPAMVAMMPVGGGAGGSREGVLVPPRAPVMRPAAVLEVARSAGSEGCAAEAEQGMRGVAWGMTWASRPAHKEQASTISFSKKTFPEERETGLGNGTGHRRQSAANSWKKSKRVEVDITTEGDSAAGGNASSGAAVGEPLLSGSRLRSGSASAADGIGAVSGGGVGGGGGGLRAGAPLVAVEDTTWASDGQHHQPIVVNIAGSSSSSFKPEDGDRPTTGRAWEPTPLGGRTSVQSRRSEFSSQLSIVNADPIRSDQSGHPESPATSGAAMAYGRQPSDARISLAKAGALTPVGSGAMLMVTAMSATNLSTVGTVGDEPEHTKEANNQHKRTGDSFDLGVPGLDGGQPRRGSKGGLRRATTISGRPDEQDASKAGPAPLDMRASLGGGGSSQIVGGQPVGQSGTSSSIESSGAIAATSNSNINIGSPSRVAHLRKPSTATTMSGRVSFLGGNEDRKINRNASRRNREQSTTSNGTDSIYNRKETVMKNFMAPSPNTGATTTTPNPPLEQITGFAAGSLCSLSYQIATLPLHLTNAVEADHIDMDIDTSADDIAACRENQQQRALSILSMDNVPQPSVGPMGRINTLRQSKVATRTASVFSGTGASALPDQTLSRMNGERPWLDPSGILSRTNSYQDDLTTGLTGVSASAAEAGVDLYKNAPGRDGGAGSGGEGGGEDGTTRQELK